jgi:Cys-tRNA(Pro)/Cys-tRNA(Cys) deacylase
MPYHERFDEPWQAGYILPIIMHDASVTGILYGLSTLRQKARMMNAYDRKLSQYMQEHHIDGELLVFSQSCHSVAEAAAAAGVLPSDLVKNICMLDAQGSAIIAIVKGEDRVSASRVAKALQIERPRTAEAAEILEKTGYPCGGTPSFGYEARFLIDPKVMEKDFVYTGGGSEYALVRVSPQELMRANQGHVVRIRS